MPPASIRCSESSCSASSGCGRSAPAGASPGGVADCRLGVRRAISAEQPVQRLSRLGAALGLRAQVGGEGRYPLLRAERLALDGDPADLSLAEPLHAFAVHRQLVAGRAQLDVHATHPLLAPTTEQAPPAAL